MGVTLREMQSAAPGIDRCLRHVLVVVSVFMIAAGVLTIDLTGNLQHMKGNWTSALAALAGVSTVGPMSEANFQLDFDFKWLLLAPPIPWAVGLVLYQRH